MGTYSTYITTKEIEQDIFEKEYHVFDSGSCQCFKDCDCFLKRGKFLYKSYSYYSPKILNKYNNSYKNYSSLKSIKQAILSKTLKSLA